MRVKPFKVKKLGREFLKRPRGGSFFALFIILRIASFVFFCSMTSTFEKEEIDFDKTKMGNSQPHLG